MICRTNPTETVSLTLYLVLLLGEVDVVHLLVRDVGLLEDEGQVEQQTDQARCRADPPRERACTL